MSTALRSLLKHYHIFIPAAILFFATSVYFLLRSDIFLLRNIQIEKQTDHRFLSQEQLAEQLGRYIARSILILDTQAIASTLTENNPALASIELHKNLQGTLKVFYREREPVAVVQTADEYLLVDADGFIFHPASERYKLSLPHLILGPGGDSADPPHYQLGDRLASGLVTAALQILNGINQITNVELERLTIHPQGTLTLQTKSGWTALLDAGKDIPSQITSLQTIVAAARMEGRGLSLIDLRFERPVVRYQ